MPRRSEPTKRELLELDIDTRLAVLWQQIDQTGEFTVEVVSQFMRAAYAFGYLNATQAPNPEAWLRSHGYRPPRRDNSE